mgnify:CR=1 FL=1
MFTDGASNSQQNSALSRPTERCHILSAGIRPSGAPFRRHCCKKAIGMRECSRTLTLSQNNMQSCSFFHSQSTNYSNCKDWSVNANITKQIQYIKPKQLPFRNHRNLQRIASPRQKNTSLQKLLHRICHPIEINKRQFARNACLLQCLRPTCSHMSNSVNVNVRNDDLKTKKDACPHS